MPVIHSLADTIRLNTGVTMPGYGFGCYKITDPAETITAVTAAVDAGYRYLDTAAFYKNEAAVGHAVRQCGLPREQVFVLSKIWPTFFDNPVETLHESLTLLGMDYLDGYLLHWPGTDRDKRLLAFEALLKEVEKGTIRALGVSNFMQSHLEELHDEFGLWPTQNQIEIHPAFAQPELCAFCAARGIQAVSWAPLGRGRNLDAPEVHGLASRFGKSPSQILLRWHLERGLLPIPKSSNPDRIRENAAVFDFSLDAAAMAVLDGMNLPDNAARTGADPMIFTG